MNTNPLATVGLMLTLASLVGSFFNIQLSQWLRDLLALAQKTQLNKANANEAQQKAIVECRIELRKLDNAETYVVNIVVFLFVVFVLCNGIAMISSAQSDPLYPHIQIALWVFLALFVALSVWLLYRGRATVRAIKVMLPALPKPKA
jgi:hypothetical protein